MPKPSDQYDVFLSHGTPDKEWVRKLKESLAKHGVAVYLDEERLDAGDNFPIGLSNGLAQSRFLVLVLSATSYERPWVTAEWTAFYAHHGPVGRVIPIFLEEVEVPPILKPAQAIKALDRDQARVAFEIARLVKKPDESRGLDRHRQIVGASFPFVLTLSENDKEVVVTDRAGHQRSVPPPWAEGSFRMALRDFKKLSQEPNPETGSKLHMTATEVGDSLFVFLFAEGLDQALQDAMKPGAPRPLVEIVSDSDLLLSLPWELLRILPRINSTSSVA